jgi:hypothetical protein
VGEPSVDEEAGIADLATEGLLQRSPRSKDAVARGSRNDRRADDAPAEEQPMSTEMSTEPRVSPWASGTILLASAILVVAGIWQVFIGTTALVHDKIYDGEPRYLYSFDLTVWGWAELLTGILSIAAGYAALRGLTWARVTGIGLASLSMIVQFMFIPQYPIWSVLVIALDVVVIYALATYRRDSGVTASPRAAP